MDRAYWIRQEGGKPHFEDLLWSRPQNKRHAGKLLIVGGNLHGFAAPAEAFVEAQKAGAGTVRVLLPNAIAKIIGHFLPAGEFAPSTPSGSFSQKALPEWLEGAHWADHILLAGDLGRNSETAILLEKFLAKSPEAVTLTKDAVDYVITLPRVVAERPNTTLILTMAQLQKFAISSGWTHAITYDMDLLQLVDLLHDYTSKHPLGIIVKQHDIIVVAKDGQVSTTKLAADLSTWRVKTSTHASVWAMQHTNQTFAALSTASTEIS